MDAVLGRVTREHKDLDLLVLLKDLPRCAKLVQQHGFDWKLEWSEGQPVEVDGLHFDSTFVDAHPDGRELDVNGIGFDPQGVVIQFHTEPWPLPRTPSPGWSDRGRDSALRYQSRPDRHALRLRPA